MLFSILIPAFKQAFLKETIISILNQTYKDFELIIVDDASPEPIKQIVEEFNDHRIRYYRNEVNCGAEHVVDNWNKCLGYAGGDYVICMGDDDKLEACCLEEYAKLIEKYPGLGVYHGQTEIIDEDSNFKRVTASRVEYESVYSLIWHRWNSRSQFIGDFLYDRKQLLAKGGFYYLPYAWGSDDITAVMMAESHGIANTAQTVFYYRENSWSISSTGGIREKVEAIEKERKWYLDFLKDGMTLSDSDKKYYVSILNCMSSFYQKKIAYQLALDMKSNRLKQTIFWMTHFRKYKLSFPIVVFAFFYSYKV